MCNKIYDINNIYLKQKVVCSNSIDKEDRTNNKNRNLCDNIVRHQFMNLLVKISMDKYMNILRETKSPINAVKMCFEKHLDYGIKNFEYNSWRKERYYNEYVDNFIKAFLPILDGLYLSFEEKKGPNKNDLLMTGDEFNNLVQNFININEFLIREIPFIFNQAINLQINEIYTDKHINMYFPEFIEALCRVVDRDSPGPIEENSEVWTLEKRRQQSLVCKLGNLKYVFIKLINNLEFKSLKDKFIIPNKDLSSGLYIIDYDNPFFNGYINYII